MKSNRSSMSKEQAIELYNDLQRTMSQMVKNTSGMKPQSKADAKRAKAPVPSKEEELLLVMRQGDKEKNPHKAIVSGIAVLVVARIALSTLDFSGVIESSSSIARASMLPAQERIFVSNDHHEADLLKQLDGRRAELEKRSEHLDDREEELKEQEREFTVKLAQLRELTKTLKNERVQSTKKEDAQIEQLAKVYGSMNPPEASALIEQLDVHIALSILERMPDKRMAQILSLMKPERALLLTKMLTGKYKE